MLKNMTQAIRYTLVSVRDMLLSGGPLAVLAIGLLALAYWWLDPTPPKHVNLATGPAQSAYEAFGKRYATALRASGIEVTLLPSEGSSDNLNLLRDGKADVGFVQGGSMEPSVADSYNLESLGSLFVEPIWLFYREDSALKAHQKERLLHSKDKRQAPLKTPNDAANDSTLGMLGQLNGMKVNIGTEGSGVPNLMQRLFTVNHVDVSTITLSHLEQTPATVAFLGGEIDALVFASAPEALLVQMLLQTPGIKLMDFPQSEAYSRRFEFLTPVVLPNGVVDLAGNAPPQDVRLVASTTALLARDGTHPALLQLFAQAAKTIHGSAGWFNRAREFPKATLGEFPLAAEADRFMRNGTPLLQHYLPFWLANLIERMWLALGIIVAVVIPLSKIVPPLYQFRIRSRVFRWYAQLRDIERRAGSEPKAKDGLVSELNALTQTVSRINVPLSYTDEQYSLLNNIEQVRKKLLRN